MTNFETLYNDVIKKSLVEKFGYKNPHEIPKLTKIVLNMGIGDAVTDKKKITSAMEELALIAGQQPVMTKARKSIATFKLREGMPIGCKVTLRSDRMYEFLERLVNMALPRIRDFHGINGKNFDGTRGTFTRGTFAASVLSDWRASARSQSLEPLREDTSESGPPVKVPRDRRRLFPQPAIDGRAAIISPTRH